MDLVERLRQYLAKANFGNAMDKFSALECLAEIKHKLTGAATCPHCSGTGRMVRDPDIGTDQECFVCEGAGTVCGGDAKIERLRAELAETHRHATQRAARMQIMRDWMTLYGAGSASLWGSFIRYRPDAVDWFDADGVPVECRKGGE